jgi:hypothetical protein
VKKISEEAMLACAGNSDANKGLSGIHWVFNPTNGCRQVVDSARLTAGSLCGAELAARAAAQTNGACALGPTREWKHPKIFRGYPSLFFRMAGCAGAGD